MELNLTTLITADLGHQVLALPVGDNGAGLEPQSTVRTYLLVLLSALWQGYASWEYGLSGNDDWQYDLYRPLRDAGLIPGWRHGYGLDHAAQARADAIIKAAILSM